MNSYRVVFSPRAEEQLLSIYHYVAAAASPVTARRFTDAIIDRCQSICVFPHQGTRRDDVRAGLRTIGFRRRVTIAFSVDEDVVTIAGVFYGGWNYDSVRRSGQ